MTVGRSESFPRWFVRGDIDGFFALALDNLIQLLVVVALCSGVLGFDRHLLYGRVLPGAAISVLVGNLYYAWQAHRLARSTGRSDVTALPYGINTVSLFAYVFLVMLPAKMVAEGNGADPAQASQLAWRVGLAACFGSAVLEILGAFLADALRRRTPRAALLSTLAGIAVSFIALGFLFKTFAAPVVGLVTLSIVLVGYFGDVRFYGGVPCGLVAVIVGTLLSWMTGLVPTDPWLWSAASDQFGVNLPVPVPHDVWMGITEGGFLAYLSVVIPMGLVNVVGSLQISKVPMLPGTRTIPALRFL